MKKIYNKKELEALASEAAEAFKGKVIVNAGFVSGVDAFYRGRIQISVGGEGYLVITPEELEVLMKGGSIYSDRKHYFKCKVLSVKVGKKEEETLTESRVREIAGKKATARLDDLTKEFDWVLEKYRKGKKFYNSPSSPKVLSVNAYRLLGDQLSAMESYLKFLSRRIALYISENLEDLYEEDGDFNEAEYLDKYRVSEYLINI